MSSTRSRYLRWHAEPLGEQFKIVDAYNRTVCWACDLDTSAEIVTSHNKLVRAREEFYGA
jgi:hypothetical protein